MRSNQKKIIELWALASQGRFKWMDVVGFLFGVKAIVVSQFERDLEPIAEIDFLYEIAKLHVESDFLAQRKKMGLRS